MIPLYFQFVNVQRRRRECTVSSDDTVQFTATKVFNSQRPRCSTSPPYSHSADSEEEVLNHYEQYIRKVATEPVYSQDGNRTGYYYDEDLAQELRVALAQSIPALREALIKNHIDKRPVIVVLGNLTD